MHASDLTDPTSSPDAPIPRFDSGRGTLTEDPPQVAPHAGAIAPSSLGRRTSTRGFVRRREALPSRGAPYEQVDPFILVHEGGCGSRTSPTSTPSMKGAFIQIMPLTWDSFLLPVMDKNPWLTI
jgi:hypothetical protein